ncbi:hypothetical protein CRP01_41410 [Flavilitoribacter nigricans DSM 23189 = NBRC 102662]|uniref:Effector-associated domain-containing protein n=1 Tax=Flavilitoribacter nigricans (strain ATCC 23147 / DSM 23189 / NBRC 102662 / NCIMB 1420 / SS-2) TaxID=1122177 RepID=A0A2D0MWP1_FLAN2|nr:hypothetical protein CRP01_41410 [Flavilitoribacter nigricans DSM 23189 = NBRC 102662]
MRDEPHQARVPLYEISGNNDSIILLLNWYCKPETLPAKISIEDARKVLNLTIGLEDLMTENSRFAAEVGEALPKLISLARRQWAATDLPQLRKGYEIINSVNETEANSVQGLIRSLETWRWIYTILWILAIHALLWLAIILLSPQFPSLQEIFIWNPTIRKWGGLGYVGLLITQIPLLRERLFHPCHQNLTAEAFPANWSKDEYFPSSQVYSLRDKKTLPVTEALHPFHGRIILEGESGLGKTMFLRNLVIDSERPVVFLPASKCDHGLVPAIQQKVPPAEGDPTFLAELVYAGALDILIDGLNEISARACAQLTMEIESKCKGNVLFTTQHMEWEAPAAAKVFQLKPLTEDQIGTYVLSRYSYLDSTELLPESAYQRNSKAYLEKAFNSELDEESLKTNFMTLSNPMELSLVAQLIARGQDPSILDLQEQQYQLMAEHYRRNNLGNDFPLAKFSKVVYDMRLNDQPEIPAEDFQKEILALQHWKMVISRQWTPAGAEKPVKYWYFRHDKIMDYFLVQEFLAKQELCEKALDDPRFRGVYFLLAFKLPYQAAMQLREQIIQYSTNTKDHSLDNFIKLLYARRPPRKERFAQLRENIRSALILGQAGQAIQLILDNTNGQHETTAVLLKNRETELNKQITEGTISSEDAMLERNKINRGILDLAQIID